MMDLVGRQNINDINFQLSLFPTRWITSYLQYHILRLDSPKDALYSAGGAVERVDPTGRAGSDVGEILTYVVNFHLTKHQDIFIQASHLFAGDFIRQTAPTPAAARSPESLYVMYNVRW
jgi:hypothetical protein